VRDAGPDATSPSTMVACGMGGTQCDLSTSICCEASNGPTVTSVCQPKATACATGIAIMCSGAANCSGGKACCFEPESVDAASTNFLGGTFSCQALVGGACPTTTLGGAQICADSSECAGGSCGVWDCDTNGEDDALIQACTNPYPPSGICSLTN
jgi:hypothetical protein